MEKMRIDRLLVKLGTGSRTEIRELLKGGALTVNGETVLRPETKCVPETDRIELNGKVLVYRPFEYWVINKPAGIITATEDRQQKTVIDYMKLKRRDMSPCGRLDKDTEGLLLITDDGELIHRLLAPSKHVDKKYEATVAGVLPTDAAARFRDGLVLGDGVRCLPAELNITVPGNPFVAELVLREGKFHQVKRMFEALGCEVVHLKRTAMGPLALEQLQLETGSFRMLTDEETERLKGMSGV